MKVEQLLEESAALLLELAVQHQLSLEAQGRILVRSSCGLQLIA